MKPLRSRAKPARFAGWACALSSLVCLGCAGPQGTISEFGQPAFEPVLGTTLLERASEEPQPKGFDAFDPGPVQTDADHRLVLSFRPMADEVDTSVEIFAQGQGELRLQDLAAAVYPATRAECQTFEATGVLPAGKPVFFSRASKATAKGRVLTMIFPRTAVPAGTAGFAIPILVRFEDGWVRVQYYRTAVPQPLRRESPEAAEARAKKELRDAFEAKRAAEAKSKAASQPEDAKREPVRVDAEEPDPAPAVDDAPPSPTPSRGEGSR